MKMYRIFIAIALLVSLFACKKTTVENIGCVDNALKEQYKNAFCTQDCPGIVGCDDKTYCNECEAARFGIRKK
jgi:hypothetical protein